MKLRMFIELKMHLSIFSIYLAGIYIVSLIFGNDLFNLPFRLFLLILNLLIAVPNANQLNNYLQSNDFKLKQVLTLILIMAVIPSIFDHIDYKIFLFGIGNFSGLLSLITGLLSFVFKNQINKINPKKHNIHTILLIYFLLIAPLIGYISFHYFKFRLNYAFLTILTTMELFGILLFLSIFYKSVTQIKDIVD